MTKKSISEFFDRLSKEDEQSKLTTDAIIRVVKESELSEKVKEIILNKVQEHIECEWQDLEFDPFVVTHFGKDVLSLECEACSQIIVSSDELEVLID